MTNVIYHPVAHKAYIKHIMTQVRFIKKVRNLCKPLKGHVKYSADIEKAIRNLRK